MQAAFSGINLDCVTATVSSDIVPVPVRLADLVTEHKAIRLQKGTGFTSLSIARPGVCTSDYACESADRLFESGLASRTEIGAVIFVSQTHDYYFPSTSHLLQGRLHLPADTVAFDVGMGCSGFVYGLYLSACLLPSLGGRKVLLCGGDTTSKLAYPMETQSRAIMGDCGFAAVLSRTEKSHKEMRFLIQADGTRADLLKMPRGGARGVRTTDASGNILMERENFSYMDGAAVMAFTLKDVPASINELLAGSGQAAGDIALGVIHQPNRMTVEALADKLGMERERLPFTAGKYGNTASASIPLGIACLGSLPEGTILFSGFGVGLSIASCLMTGSETQILPVGSL